MDESKWKEVWERFFESLDNLIQKRSDELSSESIRNFSKGASSRIRSILISGNTWIIIWPCLQLYRDGPHDEVETILYDELEALTSNNNRALSSKDVESVNTALETSKIGKESIEKLLDQWLPDWVKKLLKLLNEIISIILCSK